jgi:transcription elongation factor Elf1
MRRCEMKEKKTEGRKTKIENAIEFAKAKNGKVTCKICGTKFPAISEKRYTARRMNGLAALGGNSYYDAFDCPFCGCQNQVGIRFDGIFEQKEAE